MLDAHWVEEDLVLADNTISGHIRANWGALEATLHSGWPGVSEQIDSRGFMFGLGVSADPERGYTREGALTAHGRTQGEALLSSLHARCQAIAMHSDAVAQRLDAWRRSEGQQDQVLQAERAPLLARRREIKADLASGALTHQAHQSLRMPLNQQLEETGARDAAARRTAADSLREWCIAELGMPIEAAFLVRWFDIIVA